ncbi:MAG: TatD family hydrolase [Patescibacteria group bacterium]|nr:TatD family hydrolase [Patescibacteria group bacterium]
MLIDTHCHLNFNVFKDDSREIIKKCLDKDIWLINVGTQYTTSERAVQITKEYEKGVYAAVGLHPTQLETNLIKIKIDLEDVEYQTREEKFDYEKYKTLAKNQKVVAIGEIGLDYYYKPKSKTKLFLFKEKQKESLLEQLKLAKELNLPVIFHCRMAHNDLIELLLNNADVAPKKAVAHGFVGSAEQLQKYLNIGYYIGFNGIIFKKIEGINFQENIEKTPLERILIETDCPYLVSPNFSEKRNNPFGVIPVAKEIARIKNLSFEKVAEITFKNAKTLFKL